MSETTKLPINDDATRVQPVMPSLNQDSTDEDATRITQSPAVTVTEPQLGVGSVLKETFELVEVLGEGGMGAVYKALNKVWAEVEARDPYVALKVLKPELSANRQLVMGLFRDFDRTKMLANCPNIIKVYGFDRDGPHVYMTMEYLTGQTLSEYLNREPKTLAHAWFIIEGIGNALAYAHENNIVHRDIKPSNIIITRDGLVKVLDFGIASKINESEGDETKFSGHELGALTVAYASPEMQRDYPPDARDDIYAFACVIYEILTGKQFYKQKTHKALPIQGLNSKQMEVLNKALAFERDQRTGNIQEILEKLRPVTTPWVKILSVASGVFIILGLLAWGVVEFTNSLDVNQQVPPTVVTPAPAPVVSVPLAQTPVIAPAPAPAPPPQVQTPVITPVIVQAPEPVIASTPTDNKPNFKATSADGVIHLQTSKPEYKNGEAFHLSFTLNQPRFVRVLDRDVNGNVTVLRPNPRQPDKLIAAGKEQVFPPKGIEAPVQGTPGDSTVTLITSTEAFAKTVELLNADGSVAEQVKQGSYSWVQIRYTLLP